MIDINLVPVALRKKAKGNLFGGIAINLPQDVVLGAGGGLVLLLIVIHLLLGGLMGINLIRVMAAKAQWQDVLPDKNNLDIIANEIKDLRKKMGTINDIVAKRSIGWSRNLNVISDYMPGGVWLKAVSLDSKALTIEGFAVSKSKNEVTLIGGFVASLKKDQLFVKSFTSVEVNAISRVKRSTTEIAEFNVTAKLQ